MTRCIFLNVQSTGVTKEDRVTELSLVESIDGKLQNKTRIDLKFNPEREFSKEAKELTGHTWADYKDEDTFEMHADEIVAFLNDADYVVTHSKGFHVRMLNAELARLKPSKKVQSFQIDDTKVVDLFTRAIKYFTKDNDNKLESLSQQLKEKHYDTKSGPYHSDKKVDNMFLVLQGMANKTGKSVDEVCVEGTQTARDKKAHQAQKDKKASKGAASKASLAKNIPKSSILGAPAKARKKDTSKPSNTSDRVLRSR